MTTTQILTKDQFLAFRAKFKAIANSKDISGDDIILYNIIRGKDPKHGFSPITNKQKLDNGNVEWRGYRYAVWQLTNMSAQHLQDKFGADVASNMSGIFNQLPTIYGYQINRAD